MRISNNAVETVHWSHDGTELFYLTSEQQLFAVPVAPAAAGMLSIGTPHLLFQLDGVATMLDFDVSRDGNFLLGRRYKSTDTNPITVTLNWR